MQISIVAGGIAIAKPSAKTVNKLTVQASVKRISLFVPTALVTSKVAVAAKAASTAVIMGVRSKITVIKKRTRQVHITIVEAVLSPLNNFFLVVVVFDIVVTFIFRPTMGLFTGCISLAGQAFFFLSRKKNQKRDVIRLYSAEATVSS